MQTVSETYAEKIISSERKFALRLTFGASTVLTGTTLQDISLEELVMSGEALTMGSACSNKITVNMLNPPTDIDYDGVSFKAEAGLLLNDRPETYEWIPLGVFYGAEPETNNDFKNLTLTAYDGFCKMTGKYNATVGSETTLQAVYDDLKAQLLANCGIVLKARTVPSYTIANFPYLDITYIQAIGYVAGCLGGFARFDREGYLEIIWFEDSGITIGRRLQYMNGFKRYTGKNLMVSSLSTGTKDNPIVRGVGASGLNLLFENPYMTHEMADAIFDFVQNFSYTPCGVKWRGNPAVQAGDTIKVLDKDGLEHTVLVMSHTLKIGGGMADTIECKGSGEIKSEFSNSYETVGQKIERVYTTLETAILNATNAISGNKGGFVVFRDTNSDNKPDEILVMDSDDITLSTKVWRWNKEGLGYSYNAAGNAYNGPYKTAITADGQIVADFITSGVLSASIINGGTLKLGGQDNTSGTFELYDNSNKLIFTAQNGGLTVYAENGDYVKLNAEHGLTGYDSKGNSIYWADGDVFHMKNAEIEGEIQVAGMIKIVPVSTSDNVGVGFVALL